MDIRLKALIVEDVATEAELAVRELRQSGIYLDTHIVQDEAALRDGLSAFHPDIILSDFTLPQFDGMRALRIAREVSPDIPFIFVSGTIGEERAIEALRQGASDYVLKTNLKRLPQAIRQAIERRQLEAERLQAENQREASERKLRNIVDTIKEWIWEADADGMLSFSSSYVEILLGRRAEVIAGTCVLDYVHPDDRPSFLNALTVWHAEAPGSGIVHRWLHANHSIIWVESSASLLHDADHRVIGYRVASRDITERKKHEDMLTRVSRAHELSSKTNAAIIRIRQRQALLQEICRIAVEAGNYDMARIGLLDDDKETLHLIARAGISARSFDSLDILIREDTETGVGVTGQAVRSREVVICNDMVHDKRPVYLRQELLKLGFRALVAMPFIVKDQVVGVLNLASFQSDVFQGDEMNILRDLVSDICYALEHLE
ncbi:MAG: GAF domain-containing protein, partial [Gammaproteobacteria bacterium]